MSAIESRCVRAVKQKQAEQGVFKAGVIKSSLKRHGDLIKTCPQNPFVRKGHTIDY